jgi:hypothetical protein
MNRRDKGKDEVHVSSAAIDIDLSSGPCYPEPLHTGMKIKRPTVNPNIGVCRSFDALCSQPYRDLCCGSEQYTIEGGSPHSSHLIPPYSSHLVLIRKQSVVFHPSTHSRCSRWYIRVTQRRWCAHSSSGSRVSSQPKWHATLAMPRVAALPQACAADVHALPLSAAAQPPVP